LFADAAIIDWLDGIADVSERQSSGLLNAAQFQGWPLSAASRLKAPASRAHRMAMFNPLQLWAAREKLTA
jgi:hypothetical protein